MLNGGGERGNLNEEMGRLLLMKTIHAIASVTGFVLVGLGAAMAVTNPGPEVYHDYASQQLMEYLQENACDRLPIPIAKSRCVSAIGSVQSDIQNLIRRNTTRQNFLLWSVYKTELSLPLPLIPAYHFETIGAFQSFYTYEYKKQ
jgi:hypothetical protein